MQALAVGPLRPQPLGGGGVELGLVVLHEVGAGAGVGQLEHLGDGLPAGRDDHVGAAPLLEAAQHRCRDRAEELLEERLDVLVGGVALLLVDEEERELVPARLEPPHEVRDRRVAAGAAAEGRDDDGDAQPVGLGARRAVAAERRGAVAHHVEQRERRFDPRRGRAVATGQAAQGGHRLRLRSAAPTPR